ncbi:hypothetical protein THAOC_00744, partial [Thalassiosira oceanica]
MADDEDPPAMAASVSDHSMIPPIDNSKRKLSKAKLATLRRKQQREAVKARKAAVAEAASAAEAEAAEPTNPEELANVASNRANDSRPTAASVSSASPALRSSSASVDDAAQVEVEGEGPSRVSNISASNSSSVTAPGTCTLPSSNSSASSSVAVFTSEVTADDQSQEDQHNESMDGDDREPDEIDERGTKRGALGSPRRTIGGQHILHPSPSMQQRMSKKPAAEPLRTADESPLKYLADTGDEDQPRIPLGTLDKAPDQRSRRISHSPLDIRKPSSSEKFPTKFTLDTIGFVMSLQAKKGQIGAYVVDDENYDYYLVEFDSDPYQAERTETITLDGESFDVREGEWICKGRWLDRLPNTT